MEEARDFVLQIGPLGAALREAGEDVRSAVEAALHEALEPHHTPSGVTLDGAAWIVQARRARSEP